MALDGCSGFWPASEGSIPVMTKDKQPITLADQLSEAVRTAEEFELETRELMARLLGLASESVVEDPATR